MTETIILCTIFGVFILISFITGIKIGVKLRKSETIEIPNLNPIKVIKERKEEKEFIEQQEEEQRQIEVMLANIDAYDGTEIGQRDIPKRKE